MKALSIRQPWAWLIIHAGKDIENRSWRTWWTGRILVQASKGMTAAEYAAASLFVSRFSDVQIPLAGSLQRGGIIGTVTITACVENSHPSPWFVGPFGFVLADPEPLPFMPWSGSLGFFEATHPGAAV